MLLKHEGICLKTNLKIFDWSYQSKVLRHGYWYCVIFGGIFLAKRIFAPVILHSQATLLNKDKVRGILGELFFYLLWLFLLFSFSKYCNLIKGIARKNASNAFIKILQHNVLSFTPISCPDLSNATCLYFNPPHFLLKSLWSPKLKDSRRVNLLPLMAVVSWKGNHSSLPKYK
jgi:hypothetical protein